MDERTNRPAILISVIIPVKNGASTLRQCLQAIYKQTLCEQVEVILIDSGSTDQTQEIASSFPVRWLAVDPASFNHGLTRNFGAAQASGAFLYFTVQDARLADDNAFERMLVYFQNPEVMAVCGNQGSPHEPDKNPVYWYRPVSTPSAQLIRFTDPLAFAALPAAEQAALSAWDNVNAMYRKTALMELPFIKTDFAEDRYWAKSALEKGWAIVRDSGILAWHYHHRDFSYAFRTAFILNNAMYRFFTLLPDYPSFFKTLRTALAVLWRDDTLGAKEKGYWFFHSFSGFFGTAYAAFIFRRAASGGKEQKIKKAYERYCSNVPLGRLKGQ